LQAILHSDEPVSKKTIEATKALTYAAKYHVKIRPDVEFEMAAQSVADKSLINKIQVQGDSTNWANYIAKVNAKYDLQQPKTFSFRLDGQQTSYTTIAGGQVVYNGGNLSLESVHFENVTFDIDDNENGRRFAQALLNSTNGSVSINLQNANADHPKKID
jgi:hypothetical protein